MMASSSSCAWKDRLAAAIDALQLSDNDSSDDSAGSGLSEEEPKDIVLFRCGRCQRYLNPSKKQNWYLCGECNKTFDIVCYRKHI